MNEWVYNYAFFLYINDKLLTLQYFASLINKRTYKILYLVPSIVLY